MTPSEFLTKYPAFVGVDTVDIQAQIDAFALIYQGDYGQLTDYLTGLYVAHQVTVFNVNTSSSPKRAVESRTVDNISWKYGVPSSADKSGDFASTKYGLEFFRLMSSFGQAPIMSGA